VGREAYANIYASFPWHRKVRAIPDNERLAAVGFFTAAVVYCQAMRTDGFLAYGQLAALVACTEVERKRYTAALIVVGLFDEVEDGIEVHDYLDHNKSKDEIERLGNERAAAGKRGGIASGKARGSKSLKQGLEAKPEREEIAEIAEREESLGLDPVLEGDAPLDDANDPYLPGDDEPIPV
jgi:hypothetical protein